MIFNNPYWTHTTKIQLLQRWILVNSVMYYEYNTTMVSDQTYDDNSAQLVRYMNKYPKAAALSRYAYCFKDFDGSTGYYLFSKLNKKDRLKIMLFASNLSKRKR